MMPLVLCTIHIYIYIYIRSNFAELEYLYKGELERKDVPWISSLRDTPNKSPIRTRNNAFDKEPSFYTNDIEKWRNKFKCILEKEQNQLKELHRTTLGQYWGPKNLKIAQSRSRYDRASLGGNEQTTFSTVDIKTHGQAQNVQLYIYIYIVAPFI